mmetsp:Transcript_3409/g.5114  ORF Transcript_3409/g.5114 Transcript_3409/m.5114 type:complete len:98 (+) Transcript_3409:340-633(+)|eukprot:CAMPEP_0170480228 /NCGR_PEP_ID=MMETSP0208-20121228/1156_1 /TAXON_ID=197538 /ORGANISM="Strombidium inclinatum, Strain S3" /LENGTH=97 /DNA_ID=CAMNT_0010752745 /DNA_START=407 /DNA_END=700 /DNA_ORIENTATION=-
MRFTFNEEALADPNELLKWKDFRPQAMNKNVSEFGQQVDACAQFWSDDKEGKERQPLVVPLNNLIRKNRLICTVQEYKACTSIAKAFKAYKLRKFIH